MKSLFQSRTFWVAVAQAVGAVLVVVNTNYPALEATGYMMVFKSIADVLLRIDTTKEIG